MSDSENKKSRRALKNLPPDRFQPKMLIFWLALAVAVVALLYLTPSMTSTPEVLTIQDVVARGEGGNVKPNSVIRPDPSGGRDWVTIIGESRKDANSPFKAFRASGRDTEAIHDRLTKTNLFREEPSQTLLTSI